MSLAVTLPLLPLAVALWLALSSRPGQLAAGWVVALVAACPVAVAGLAAPMRIEIPELLVMGTSALVLDDVSRAALLLFGGLWLTAGMLSTRVRGQAPPATAMLVGLSGALTLALAEGGPLVYAGMLVTGYGLYAIMAGEPGDDWRRGARALIVLLVASDLLVFELLLTAAAKPGIGLEPGLLLIGLAALLLRGGMPPAHVWLPPALAAVGTPVAVLLVAVPTGAALFGVLKILPGGAAQIGVLCLLLGLAGAAWATLAGLAQLQARATLGYALAASAALLLIALPAGAGSEGQLAWLGVALLASCAAVPLVALQHAGWTRDAVVFTALFVHGLAGGRAALHAASALPMWIGLLAPLAAVAATLLLTVTVMRTAALARDDTSLEGTRLAFAPIFIACAGLGFAWSAKRPEFASIWVAPVGVTFGLVAFWIMPKSARPYIPPGDLLAPVERLIGQLLRMLRVLCMRDLPRLRDRIEAGLLGLWDGEAWSRRIQWLDFRLRAWPATGLMMLLVALGVAFLLVE
jgi:hypothetical protein